MGSIGKLTPEQMIQVCAAWEQERRTANKGKAKDDKTPAMASLTGEQLEAAAATGKITVAS